MTEKTWLLPNGQTIWYKHKAVDPSKRMDEQAKQIRKLKKRLKKYGGHTDECAIWDYSSPSHRRQQGHSDKCDCGWERG